MLLALVGAVALIVRLYPERKVSKIDPGLSELAAQLNQRLQDDSNERSYQWSPLPSSTSKQSLTLEMSNFDPNLVSSEELNQMGLPERFSKSLLAYRNRGGKFRYREDVEKLYGLTAELYESIESYISLPNKGETTSSNSNRLNYHDSLARRAGLKVELNSADSASLVALKGIGPATAKRILIYRKRLGGFYSVGQLADIYGIKLETIKQLKEVLVLDTSLIRRIELNSVSVDTLASHPYFTLYQARAIEYYRLKVGTIHGMQELVQNRILPADVAQKSYPYIKF